MDAEQRREIEGQPPPLRLTTRARIVDALLAAAQTEAVIRDPSLLMPLRLALESQIAAVEATGSSAPPAGTSE